MSELLNILRLIEIGTIFHPHSWLRIKLTAGDPVISNRGIYGETLQEKLFFQYLSSFKKLFLFIFLESLF